MPLIDIALAERLERDAAMKAKTPRFAADLRAAARCVRDSDRYRKALEIIEPANLWFGDYIEAILNGDSDEDARVFANWNRSDREAIEAVKNAE